MTERELNITLREMARSVGLCDPWYNEWTDDSTIDECLERYIRGFDFVQERDWPPLEFIRNHFSKEQLHKHNIFIDEDVDIEAGSGFYVFLGNCTGSIVVNGFYATTIYLRHESNIKVTSLGAARVFLHCYDNSKGKTHTDRYGKIRKYDKRKKEG